MLTKDAKYDALEAIRRQHPQGRLQARNVVTAAQAPEHPLHAYFQWDATKAAHAFRLVQARNLIRSVIVLRSQDPRPVAHPVYVSLPQDRGQPGGGYRPIDEVLTAEVLRQEMLTAALRDLQAWGQRYRMFERLAQPTVRRFEELLGAERAGPSLAAAD